jgi:hypothetical protein
MRQQEGNKSQEQRERDQRANDVWTKMGNRAVSLSPAEKAPASQEFYGVD